MLPRPSRRRLALAFLLMASASLSCSPGGDIQQAELMMDLNDLMNEMRQETAVLQDQIDALREDVARQDTLIRRMANLNGLALP